MANDVQRCTPAEGYCYASDDGEYVEYESFIALTAENERLRAQVAALDWQEITPENLPNWKRRDEIGGYRDGSWYVSITGTNGEAETWVNRGWTHFRPINAPEKEKNR